MKCSSCLTSSIKEGVLSKQRQIPFKVDQKLEPKPARVHTSITAKKKKKRREDVANTKKLVLLFTQDANNAISNVNCCIRGKNEKIEARFSLVFSDRILFLQREM